MSEVPAVVFQEGDRVKYEYNGDIDYGTVVEVEGSVHTIGGNIWAVWDSTKMKQYSKREYLTLISRKEQPKPTPKHPPHKYAGVIKHWADGGEIQFKYEDVEWTDYESRETTPNIGQSSLCIWRIKPKTKTISYRVGITKDNQVKVYHEEPTLDDAYGSDAFKNWLDTEWRTVEVEV